MTRLPFIVNKLHAGVELVKGKAVFHPDPVRTCKLNVQQNSAPDGRSRGGIANGLVVASTGRKSKRRI